MSSNYFSTMVGWLIPISRAMEEAGLNVKEMLSQCGFQEKDILNQESRVATDKFSKLVSLCNKATGRKDFAIAVARNYHPGMLHALGYAMMSSNTLHDALERIARYKRVVSNSCTLSVRETEGQLHFDMHVLAYEDSGRPVLDQDLVEVFLGSLVQFSRLIINKHISPVEVRLNWPKPKYDTSFLDDFFKCDVTFSNPEISLVFDKEVTDSRIMARNPEVTQANEKILDDLLSRIDKGDLVYRIKNKIYEDLPMGAPSQNEVAEYLGMSLRNLQRKLQDKGTNYKEILESSRKHLALEYIQQPHLTLSEVGYLVGFSSLGNFNRAFKRWTGTAPGMYRNEFLESA